MCGVVLKRKMLAALAPVRELRHSAVPSAGRYPAPSHARSAGLRRRHGRLRYGEPIARFCSFLLARTSNGGSLGQRSYASICAGDWGCCHLGSLEGETRPKQRSPVTAWREMFSIHVRAPNVLGALFFGSRACVAVCTRPQHRAQRGRKLFASGPAAVRDNQYGWARSARMRGAWMDPFS